MNNRDRLPQAPTILPQYKASAHIQQIQTKDGPRPYYSAGWKLYELSLRYPDANFLSDIVFIDAERDIVVIKVKLFFGPNWEDSPRKIEAHKQGPLSKLDKLETSAKARCLGALGISTESALASRPTLDETIAQRLNDLYTQAKELGLMEKPNSSAFMKLIAESLDIQVETPQDLTHEDLDAFEAFLESREPQ